MRWFPGEWRGGAVPWKWYLLLMENLPAVRAVEKLDSAFGPMAAMGDPDKAKKLMRDTEREIYRGG